MRKDIPRGAYTSLDITNSANQLIADKLQFFADCLRLICLKSGEYYHYEIENHLTLIRNLKFYADGEINSINPKAERTKNTIKQIQFIVKTHPLFSEDDKMINLDSTTAVQVKNCLNQVKDEPYSTFEYLVNIKSYLERIENLLSPSYVENVVQDLFKMIQCKHTLNHHKSELEYLAKLVFSHFHAQGHSRERIHGLIDRLLEKKVRHEGDGIYTDAPLPRAIYERLINHNQNEFPFDQVLFDDIQHFLDNRNLKQQIDGFVYLDQYDKYPFRYIFRVDGVMTWPDEFELLGLKFIDLDYFIKQFSEEQMKYATEFFMRNNHSVLTEVSVDAYSHDEAVHLAIKFLIEKLGIISMRTNGRFAINQIGYTFYPTEGEGFWINTMPEPGSISKYDVENIEYIENSIANSSHKEFYLQLENILAEGYIEDNFNTSLHHLRKFMQVLFDNINTSGIGHLEGVSDEIRVLSYLLVYFEKGRYSAETLLWAINMASNMNNLTDEAGEYRKFRDKLRLGKRISPNEIISSTVKEHVKFEARKIHYYSRKIDNNYVFNYYARQLLFIKQYRDKHEHASSLDNQIARKLNLFAYKLMKRLLDNIFKELNKKENVGIVHQNVIRTLVDEGMVKVNGI